MDHRETHSPSEAIPKVLPFKQELLRKSLHLVALIIPAGMLWLGKYPSALILGSLAGIAIFLDILRVKAPNLNHLLQKIFGPLMRPKEKTPQTPKFALNGATWSLVSAFLLVSIFPVQVAAFSFAMFMVADGAAAVVGQRWGRKFWGKSSKTLEGSLAFLIAALVVVVVFPGINLWIGAAASVCACLAELLPGPFNDNLRVPLISACVVLLGETLAVFP